MEATVHVADHHLSGEARVRKTKQVRSLAVGLAALALVVSGLLTSWWGTEPVVTDDLLARTCELANLAETDPPAAANGFLNDVHGPIHTVANDLLSTDRSAAARLLEAKFGVERMLNEGAPADTGELSAQLTQVAERLPGASCEEM